MKLYRDVTKADVNYEYLFNLTNTTGGDPNPSSLFNLDTLKQLIQTGENTLDVIDNPHLNSVDLSNFTNLTTILGLQKNE